MAKAIINLQKESGGIVKISPVDGIGVTEVTVPESGTLATLESPTFTGSVVVPTPTTGTQAVNKDYVDTGAGVAFIANDNRVKTALNATGSAPIYACRAWVNFNGTGTVTIRASGNVSSVVDNGNGNYTVNFATAMPDANYSTSGFASDLDGTGGDTVLTRYPADIYTSSSVQIRNVFQGVGYDGYIISLQIFK